MEIELNNEQTTPSQQQEQRKASHDLAAARLVKRINEPIGIEFFAYNLRFARILAPERKINLST